MQNAQRAHDDVGQQRQPDEPYIYTPHPRPGITRLLPGEVYGESHIEKCQRPGHRRDDDVAAQNRLVFEFCIGTARSARVNNLQNSKLLMESRVESEDAAVQIARTMANEGPYGVKVDV